MRSATVRAAIRRGWVCPIMPADAAAQLEADLGQLGGLARAGLAGDDHDLVVADGRAISSRRSATGSCSGTSRRMPGPCGPALTRTVQRAALGVAGRGLHADDRALVELGAAWRAPA